MRDQTPSIRAQIDAHIRNARKGTLFRANVAPEEAARLAKHAPNTWAAWNSETGDWNAITAAIHVDMERLYNAKAGGRPLSAEGQETFDTLAELRHLTATNARIDENLHCDAAVRFDAGRGFGDSWRDSEGRPVAVLGPKDSFGSGPRHDLPTFGDVIKAAVTRKGVAEINAALGGGTIGAGGALVPAPLAGDVIDRMRARMVTIQAGARTIPLPNRTLDIARVVGAPTLSWAAESASISDTGPTFDRVSFAARTLRAWLKVSRELVEDAANLNSVLIDLFGKEMALELDRAALVGSGAGVEPRGIGNATSAAPITSMATNGAPLTNFDPIVNVWQALLDANANGATAMVMSPRTAATIAKLKDTTNQPLRLPPALESIPRLVTTSMPTTQAQGTSNNASSIIMGDWSQLMIGIRSELQVVITEAAFMASNEVGLLFVMRADVQWTNASQFVQLRGITP